MSICMGSNCQDLRPTPFVDKARALHRLLPADCASFHIISGPNMAGKSTYLRQVAIMAVMAHAGCFVPAKFAAMPVMDRLLTRLGSSDCIEHNSSSFLMEMQAMCSGYPLRGLLTTARHQQHSHMILKWHHAYRLLLYYAPECSCLLLHLQRCRCAPCFPNNAYEISATIPGSQEQPSLIVMMA